MTRYDLHMSAAKIKKLEARVSALEKMMRRREHDDFVRSIQAAIAEVDRGESVPARKAFAQIERKHRIPALADRSRRA